jgi:hypothetical protein
VIHGKTPPGKRGKMRLIQIIPKRSYRLYGAIVKKEVDLHKKGKGTFFRSAAKEKDVAKWSHRSYKGWIWIKRGLSEVVLVELRTLSSDQNEWQLLHAFLGFLDRHFADNIEAINIQYF